MTNLTNTLNVLLEREDSNRAAILNAIESLRNE